MVQQPIDIEENSILSNSGITVVVLELFECLIKYVMIADIGFTTTLHYYTTVR